jgi:tyrosyl-tRNA synthetase
MTPEQQLDALAHGCVDLHTREELLEKLRSGRPLRVKYGADPSAPDLHLGHSVPLRRLRQFQELGHQVVFIIGDFTGRIGDPSGRSKTRPVLTEEQIRANAATYAQQVGQILDVSRCEVHYNSEWYGPMTATELLSIASHYTVAQMLERDDFALRFRDGVPITLLEMYYPIVQGYDSVAVRADVEIGGTDQLFNFQVGRDIMRAFGLEPQVVMTWPLLVGTDGREKMSKSLGNFVGITEPPNEMYGKLMSIPDEPMGQYCNLLLNWNAQQVTEQNDGIAAGRIHPRDAKGSLAAAVVAQYHGEAAASAAAEEFSRIFSRHEKPAEMPELVVTPEEAATGLTILQLVLRAGFAKSNGEARRLIRQGAVRLDDRIVADELVPQPVADRTVLQVGKRHFGRVTVRPCPTPE